MSPNFSVCSGTFPASSLLFCVSFSSTQVSEQACVPLTHMDTHLAGGSGDKQDMQSFFRKKNSTPKALRSATDTGEREALSS